MRIFKRPLNGFDGIPSGGISGTATCKITGGSTINEIFLKTNLTADQFSVIVRLNGTPIYSLDGTDLVMLERYRKRFVRAGVFMICFSDIVNATVASRDQTALVTFPTDNLYIEVKVNAGYGGTIQLAGHMNASPAPRDGLRHYIPNKYRTSVRAGQTAKNKLVPVNPGPFLQRLHFLGDITHMTVSVQETRDGGTYPVFESPDDINQVDLERNDRAPQDGWYHVDFIASDFGNADLLETRLKTINPDGSITYGANINNIEFMADVDTPGDIPVLIEYFTEVPNPAAQPAGR